MGVLWRDFEPQVLDKEIKDSMIRNEIENLTFKCKLLSVVKGNYLKRCTDYNYYEKNKYEGKGERKWLENMIDLMDSNKQIYF